LFILKKKFTQIVNKPQFFKKKFKLNPILTKKSSNTPLSKKKNVKKYTNDYKGFFRILDLSIKKEFCDTF
jgi:hypothetical protein